ncbi:hypothetical protein Areg01_78110 [Actinoplanes regularis]|nr:hypothetical protein Are01nite_77010 [Actinoplanes regularis]GLW34875.1 hypothetical protein Areg01_78110 [Actinoplanes regularis]
MAYLIDTFTVAAVAGAAVTALGMVSAVIGAEAHQLARLLVSSYLVFLPALLALYCTVFWGLAGRTPGMALLGVRVVRADGTPVRWLAALIRALLLAYFPIGALWLIVDRRHQGLADKVAMTTVVREG